jgi:pimeloyl-ACP methyl ester carboxylesterase
VCAFAKLDGVTERRSLIRVPCSWFLVPLIVVALVATLLGEPSAVQAQSNELAWEVCGGYECARLAVPLNYGAPEGRQIEIALLRVKAREPARRIGSLLVNPGGPGASGNEFVRLWALLAPGEIRDRFDIIGFDPRGVGDSTPLNCHDDIQRIAALDPTPDSSAEWTSIANLYRTFAETCARRHADLLPHLGSDNVVRDMDRIRAALGDEKLTYLGYSYGTVLGALYADLFPERVRALVLDGAVDTSLDGQELGFEQALGFETALSHFAASCRERTCLPEALGDPIDAIEALLQRAEAAPIPAPSRDRPAGEGETMLAIIVSLYSRATWGALERAIEDGFEGDGNRLVQLADLYLGRENDGSYPNQTEVNAAVNCLDYEHPRDPVDYEEDAVDFEKAAPHFGAAIASGGLVCAFWSVEAKPLPTPRGTGAPPVLVIGTTGDPATPHHWAVALSEQLESGVLLSWEGEGHTAYRNGSSSCIDDIVNAYLLSLTLPPGGTTCDAEPAATPSSNEADEGEGVMLVAIVMVVVVLGGGFVAYRLFRRFG